MGTGLYRIKWTRIAGLGNRLPGLPAVIGRAKMGLLWSAVALAAIGGAWTLVSGEFGDGAEGEPVVLAVVAEPTPGVTPAAAAAQDAVIPPEAAEPNAPEALPEAAASADRLSQRRRTS